MRYFEEALLRTLEHEGEGQRSNRANDPGGDTYSGISRVYWPDWSGWEYIDRDNYVMADNLVPGFYEINFWNRTQGDKLANLMPEIAYEVFDTAVHAGVKKAVRILQTAYNVANGGRYHLLVDGLLGPKTLEAIKRYLATEPGLPETNADILLNCMNGEQYIYYKANPLSKENRGWFRRL